MDKIGQNNYHGDPAAALLEVLDPEQNHSFNVSQNLFDDDGVVVLMLV